MQAISQENDETFIVARGLALFFVLLSTALPFLDIYPVSFELLGLTGLVTVTCATDGNMKWLGLRARPQFGWWYWFRFAIAVALCIAVVSLILAGLNLAFSWGFVLPRSQPTLWWIVVMLISAPVSEEVLYRSLLVSALLPTLGKRWTVVVGGVLFSLIHVFAGNPGPDNQIAGFF